MGNSKPWLDRLALYGIPVLAGVTTAVVLLGAGAERPAAGARVRGLLVAGARRWALRLETKQHHSKTYRPLKLEGLRTELRAGGELLGAWQGSTDGQGLAEAQGELAAPLPGRVELLVTHRGAVLARSPAAPLPALEPVAIPPLPAIRTQGAPLEVALDRGQAVPPFPEQLTVTLITPREATGHRLELRATGADVIRIGQPAALPCEPPSRLCRHRWRATIAPRAHLVELTVAATATGSVAGRWEGEIPVAAGRLWLDPQAAAAGQLRLQSPSPKERAYVSLLGRQGRLWGAVVPLQTDARGIASGGAKLPAIAGPLAVVLSSEPEEPPDVTVSWPLRPTEGLVAGPELQPLADGLPQAIAAETQRVRRARIPAIALVIAAGIFELLYLWRRSRISRARLQDHLRRSAAAADSAEPAAELSTIAASTPVLWLTVALGGLVLAFAALAVLVACY